MKESFETIFNQAQQNHRAAQREIYNRFSTQMLKVALSYMVQKQDAEDVLMEAFYKAFTKINTCKSAQAFPAWLRRIVINQAISFIRKQKKYFICR